jgi:hypothetical protein
MAKIYVFNAFVCSCMSLLLLETMDSTASWIRSANFMINSICTPLYIRLSISCLRLLACFTPHLRRLLNLMLLYMSKVQFPLAFTESSHKL